MKGRGEFETQSQRSRGEKSRRALRARLGAYSILARASRAPVLIAFCSELCVDAIYSVLPPDPSTYSEGWDYELLTLGRAS